MGGGRGSVDLQLADIGSGFLLILYRLFSLRRLDRRSS